MQLDMHYYGVYVLARLAGLGGDTARVIAYASQYVDDAVEDVVESHASGAMVVAVETAHLVLEGENFSLRSQREVWVPFHFLPGNLGHSFHERLVCRKDSALAQAMLRYHLGHAGAEFAPHLVGVAAHVYADSFSHHGFSGVSSPLNRIRQKSLREYTTDEGIREYIKEKRHSFREKYGRGRRRRDLFPGWGHLEAVLGGWLAEEAAQVLSHGALGHAAAYTYPDRPYLRWRFRYEYQSSQARPQVRDNPADFLEACQKLHAWFTAFARRRPELQDPAARREFGGISGAVAEVLALEGTQEERILAWEEALGMGELNPKLKGEDIPPYRREDWDHLRRSFPDHQQPEDIVDSEVYRFYQAAGLHREYVLHKLLPAAGLVVH